MILRNSCQILFTTDNLVTLFINLWETRKPFFAAVILQSKKKSAKKMNGELFCFTKDTMKYKFLGIFIISIITLSACKAKKKEPSFEHAMAALEHKNIKEAVAYLDTSIAHDPQPRYYALKGTLLYQIHDFKGSKKVFEKVLKK